MSDQVAAVFDRLPPDERTSAAALVGNYGEAGAIEQLGRGRGLRAISGHNNYWLWGPDDASGDILIVLSRSRERQEQRFASVELAGEIDCGDCMPYENHLSIFICRRMKPLPSTRDGTNPAADADDVSRTLRSQWPSFKHYE